MKSLQEIIIDSLDYEFNLDLYHNRKQNKHPFIFRPYGREVKNKFLRVLHLIFSVIVLMASPFLFLFRSKLIRYRVTNGTKFSDVYFISSDKAKSIFSKNIESADTTYFSLNSGVGIDLGFNAFIAYVSILFAFFKRFYREVWFYKECILILEMMAVYNKIGELKPKKIIMTNQLDRWAMLMSLIAKEFHIEIVLYQHGLISSDYKPKVRLPVLDKLYSYNKCESDFFNNYVVEELNDVEYISTLLEMYSVDSDFNVLLIGVGNPSLIDLEYCMASYISNIEGVSLYFKAHPVLVRNHDYSTFSDLNLSIVSPKGFPIVDVVIHFGSTLALEYQNSIPSLVIYECHNQNELLYIVSEIKGLVV